MAHSLVMVYERLPFLSQVRLTVREMVTPLYFTEPVAVAVAPERLADFEINEADVVYRRTVAVEPMQDAPVPVYWKVPVTFTLKIATLLPL